MLSAEPTKLARMLSHDSEVTIVDDVITGVTAPAVAVAEWSKSTPHGEVTSIDGMGYPAIDVEVLPPVEGDDDGGGDDAGAVLVWSAGSWYVVMTSLDTSGLCVEPRTKTMLLAMGIAENTVLCEPTDS